MITNDYRNTEYCPMLEKVVDKKKALEEKIRSVHPRQKIMYNKVHDRDKPFYQDFCSIYNYKCAYCGVSRDILSATLFEVDHFVAKSLFDDKEEAGKVENLVLSCYQCNRNKKDFEITGEYIKKLNTDDGKITNIFFRDNKYYIRIKEDYIEDETINVFYNKLKLFHQKRRLEYLLMNMYGLQRKLEGTDQGRILAEEILKMQSKLNKFV